MNRLLSIVWCASLVMLATFGRGVATSRQSTDSAASAQGRLEDIIDVEREFARDSIERGVKRSFLRYAAPDAVIFRPRPVPALTALEKDPDDDPTQGFLDWWPALAAISRSGDLGFSLGPWHQHLTKPNASYPQDTYGYYCTVWRRQPDGRWRFVIDGAGAFLRTTVPTRSRGTTVTRLPIASESRSISAERALAEVKALEAELAGRVKLDARANLPRYYTDDAWVMGSSVEVQPGRNGWEAELSRRPSALVLELVGGDASLAGDLAYTYGLVDSGEPGVSLRDATYLHIWMRRANAWRIVFDGLKQRRSLE